MNVKPYKWTQRLRYSFFAQILYHYIPAPPFFVYAIWKRYSVADRFDMISTYCMGGEL